jgi:2-polyprenyl-3-methyl-5-hydroxy-6-metoxy-1,4-benzoquinol methylase
MVAKAIKGSSPLNSNLFIIDKKPDRYYYDRKEMIEFVPSNVKKVLDVGCGEGQFGQLLKSRYDVEVWGVEIFEDVAEKARARIDKVLVGDIEAEEFALPPNYFDCIVFNDTLEHLRYPWIVLRRIHANLKENGYVVASIPNVRFYENMKNVVIRKNWEYTDAGVMDKTHLRYFTIKSIRNLFERCEFQVILIKGIKRAKFPWKFGLLNALLFNALDDMRYMQFVCVARKKGNII